MSDAAEKTVGGATRVLFGTIAFICLMVGIEGMTGMEKLSVGLSALLIAVGAICAYAAFFWETAKKVLSKEAQDAIGQFSRHNATKASLLFAILISIILSPYVEQHRWPFSYPADPAIEAENTTLKEQARRDAVMAAATINQKNNEIAIANEAANKWKFSSRLRAVSIEGNNSRCTYQFVPDTKTRRMFVFWEELFRAGDWKGNVSNNDALDGTIQYGITIRAGAISTIGFRCGSELQKALTDIYPNPPARFVADQTTEFLKTCGPQNCVQIEVSY